MLKCDNSASKENEINAVIDYSEIERSESGSSFSVNALMTDGSDSDVVAMVPISVATKRFGDFD